MGLNYSFGITFTDNEDAELCRKDFVNQKIILSPEKNVNLGSFVCEHADNKILEEKLYVLSVSIDNLGISCKDLSLFERSNFYTIRDFFYEYLRDMKVGFEFAHFELEAADYLMCATDMTDDIGWLLKNKSEGDENAAKASGIDKFYFLSKRYIDGIVVSSKKLKKISKYNVEFQPFKPEYYWLPVTEFKLSK
ncbi:hypothetical protein [Chryseobacterium sp. 3008163]|uniref:hypothetical protein n=1 Tax=Chryseobacterium sp. 3008163 TaxID=2478663 RepID=UPI000F0C4347|nr:hypothetical protein [Chryseobacterium sp. 3008163]AYN00162.1 hypothetical protein EAG08_07315 [Chryseobacterium sp. 3008163]